MGQLDFICAEHLLSRVKKIFLFRPLEKGIPRGRIGLNYLFKFVCTKWAV